MWVSGSRREAEFTGLPIHHVFVRGLPEGAALDATAAAQANYAASTVRLAADRVTGFGEQLPPFTKAFQYLQNSKLSKITKLLNAFGYRNTQYQKYKTYCSVVIRYGGIR